MARRLCPTKVATACLCAARPQALSMFMVGEATADAMGRTWDEGGAVAWDKASVAALNGDLGGRPGANTQALRLAALVRCR